MSTQNSDESMIASILQSMGIHKHDPLVVTALNEYARRYAGTLLTDAKCYSEYAGRSEIGLEDMQIAVKLSDEHTLGMDPRQRKIKLIVDDVNTGEGRDLMKLLNKEAVLNRYPPGTFPQRCYSFIPGVDAFPENVPTEEVGSSSKTNEEHPRKRSTSFSFHPKTEVVKQVEDNDSTAKKIRFNQTAIPKDRITLTAPQGFIDTESEAELKNTLMDVQD